MSSENITLSGPDVLCEYVPINDVKGFFQDRIGIGPDLMALLIRDGRVAHASAGAHIALGGFWQSLKESLTGSHALKLLIADLKPFSTGCFFTAVTRDSVPVEGEVIVEVQVNPERPAGILGFAADHEVVPKSVIWGRLAPHLADRVLRAVVSKVDALALRGDADVQNKVQVEVMSEAERLFGDMGLLVRGASVNWGFNDEELAEIQKRAEAREQEMLDAKLLNLSREIARTAEVTELQLNTQFSEEKLKASNEHELRQMLVDQELEFLDAKETGARVRRMKALQGEIAELKVEQGAKFDMALGEAKNELDLRRVRMEIEKLDRETDRLKREQESALRKLEELDKLAIAAEAHKQQAAALAGVQNVEIEGEAARADIQNKSADSEHAREMERRRQEAEARVAELTLKANMTPDQLLAHNAGLSPDVAAVFAERAKAESSDTAEKMALMERLIESGAQTGEQAKFFFEQFKEGVVGVARGGATPDNGAGPSVLCPRCRGENPGVSAFCQSCGSPLRG